MSRKLLSIVNKDFGVDEATFIEAINAKFEELNVAKLWHKKLFQ